MPTRALLAATMVLAMLGGCLQTRSLPPRDGLETDDATARARTDRPPAPPPPDLLPMLNH